MFELRDNSEVYCWLKHQLEPRYTVVSEPQADYFSEWTYCYQVFDRGQLVGALTGDHRELAPGQLVQAAVELAASLNPQNRTATETKGPDSYPVASRLPPMRHPTTWFSSGRAAFAWILSEGVCPRRLHLPTLICWSLVNVLQSHFRETELCFYPVDRHLQPRYPDDPQQDDAILYVHYFGYRSPTPASADHITILEDCSHLVSSFQPMSNGYAFGSLRKIYPTADGGYLRGAFNPVYEAGRRLDAWLRMDAADWKDLREAENMTDRHWTVSDISSQSLATVLSADDDQIVQQRRHNESLLADSLTVGTAMKSFATNECPLLHNRFLPTSEERDSLKQFLAGRGIFCSIHWPVHPLLLEVQDKVDITDAVWIRDHVLSIPVAQNYGRQEMEQICAACDDWARAGSARFGTTAA